MTTATPATSRPAIGFRHEAEKNWPDAAGNQADAFVPGPRIAAHDMRDDPAEIRQWFPGDSAKPLTELLGAIDSPLITRPGKTWSVLSSYELWDAAALEQQRNYVRLVRASGCFAVLAVMLAILQLPQAEWERIGVGEWSILRGLMNLLHLPNVHAVFEAAETLSAALAVAAVTIGIVSAMSHRWQLRRLQAEQCRFLKFGYLLRCATSVEAARDFLRKGLETLHALDDQPKKPAGPSDLSQNPRNPGSVSKLWIRRDINLVDVDDVPTGRPSGELLPLIVKYFVHKRIRYQAQYFQRQAHRREWNEKVSKWLPVVLFFLSLVFAIAHFAGPLAWHGIRPAAPAHAEALPAPHQAEDVAEATVHHQSVFGMVCLLCAAGLPAIGAWIRTYRGALEFARNANRFHGMWIQLHEFEQELAAHQQAANLEAQLQTLRDVEIALETEHRSWTRLMIEAEWYG